MFELEEKLWWLHQEENMTEFSLFEITFFFFNLNFNFCTTLEGVLHGFTVYPISQFTFEKVY